MDDDAILAQLKQGQSETNERIDQFIGEQMNGTDALKERLDKLIAVQERTNQLIEWLGTVRPPA